MMTETKENRRSAGNQSADDEKDNAEQASSTMDTDSISRKVSDRKVRWTQYRQGDRDHEKWQWTEDNELSREKFKNYRYRTIPELFEFKIEDGKPEPRRWGNFYFDLDDKDDQELTVIDARKIIEGAEADFGVPREVWQIWLSGSKGIHLKLPAHCFGLAKGDPELPYIYKGVAREFFHRFDLSTADMSIYNMGQGRMFRRENIKRENGKYKVPITLGELMNKSFADLIPLCDAPRKIDIVKVPGKPSKALMQLAADAKVSLKEKARRAANSRSPDEIKKILGDDHPKCIELIINDDSEVDPLCRNFNFIAQTLTRYCHMKGMDKAESVEFCQEFIEGYEGSSSLKTPKARKKNFENRWKSMKGSDFECFHARCLQVEGIREACRKCPVEHLPLKNVKQLLDGWIATMDVIEDPEAADDHDGWCRIIHKANPRDKIMERKMLKHVHTLLSDPDFGISEVKSTYNSFLVELDEIEQERLEREESEKGSGGSVPAQIQFMPERLGKMTGYAEKAMLLRPPRPKPFIFGGAVCYLEERTPAHVKSLDGGTPPKVPGIVPFKEIVLRSTIEQSITFTKKNNKGKLVPRDVPIEVCKNMI